MPGELSGAKTEGEEVALAEEPPQATNVVDLMEVLQDSLAQQQAQRAATSRPRRGRERRGSRKATVRESAGKATKKAAAKKASAGQARASAPGRGPGKDELRQLSCISGRPTRTSR
ncbi:hypothetical protein AB0K93_34475, partial [Streptomyces sp. NPDC052676]